MQRSKVLWPAPSRVAGTVVLAFCSLAPLSRAGVVVDNLGNTSAGSIGGDPLAQVFTMPTSGTVSAVTLQLQNISASAEVYIYDATGGAPVNSYGSGNYLYDLGNIATGSGGVVTLNPTALSAGDTYAIVIQPPSGSSWNYTLDSTGGSALGQFYDYSGGVWNLEGAGVYLKMDLEVSPVPEIPITGVAMGFGALAVAGGCSIRRKLAVIFPASLQT